MTLNPAYGQTSAAGEGGTGGLPDFAMVEHNDAGDNITLTGSTATYEWTGITQESDPSLLTLTATDEIVFNEAGVYKIEWKILAAGTTGTPAPYWIVSFLELDPLGSGSDWAYVNASLAATTCSDDPGGGQSKVSHQGLVVISVDATDELRVRIRRGGLAADAVITDGSNGSTLLVTRVG